MKYDFSLVKRAIDEKGMTLEEVKAAIGGKVHEGTISRAISTGRALPSTARMLATFAGVKLKRLLPPRRKRRRSAMAPRTAA